MEEQSRKRRAMLLPIPTAGFRGGWPSLLPLLRENLTGNPRGRIFHLWHGDLRDRQYAERVPTMRQFDYDPAADIAPSRD